MSIVRFNYADVKPLTLGRKNAVKSFLIEVFELEGKGLKRLDYIFCTDLFLLDINKSFLQHDYFTDIITFDLSEDRKTIGEIYISVDRVKENSTAHNTTYKNELLRVLLHGALHLIGYNDKKKSEITVMREKEEYYLQLFATK